MSFFLFPQLGYRRFHMMCIELVRENAISIIQPCFRDGKRRLVFIALYFLQILLQPTRLRALDIRDE